MSLFTNEDANNSKITRAESVTSDGTHTHWIFGVKDVDNNYYDWIDRQLPGTATNDEQRVAIYNYLTTECEKTPAPPVVLHIENPDVINTVVGATGP